MGGAVNFKRMALNIIQASDFQGGKYAISQNRVSNLSSFIEDVWIKHWIRVMLGATEGDAFIADLDPNGNPQDAKYQTINNALNFEYAGCPFKTVGIAEILQMLFFADYTAGQATFNQTSGNSTVTQEASEADKIKANLIYNQAIENMRHLALYVRNNTNTYTDYKDGGVFELDFADIL